MESEARRVTPNSGWRLASKNIQHAGKWGKRFQRRPSRADSIEVQRDPRAWLSIWCELRSGANSDTLTELGNQLERWPSG